MFSSVLRISSGGVRIWTHYDVTDNVYCQIIGRKSAVLWPPSQANNMYLQGKILKEKEGGTCRGSNMFLK